MCFFLFRLKRVVIVKQLSSGLLLVTGKRRRWFDWWSLFFVFAGPSKLNGVALSRVNQIYVIATSTKLDLSSADFSKYDDKFFKRVRQAKKNGEKDIFEQKKEVKVKSWNHRLTVMFLCFAFRKQHSVLNVSKHKKLLTQPFLMPSKLMLIHDFFVNISRVVFNFGMVFYHIN